MKLFDFDAYDSMTRFIDRKKPCVIIDVGAHDGSMVTRALNEFPQARIYAFEPAPTPLARLQKKHGNDKRVSIHALACGSAPGNVTMNITRDPYCSSLLKPSETGSHFYGDKYDVIEEIKVPRITLDQFAAENGINHIDFLKIDTQGHDLEVLRGAKRLLASGGIKAVNAEAEFVPEYEGAASFREVDAFFASIGFQLHQIHEVVSAGPEVQTTYCDALWVRESELKALRTRKELPILGLRARLDRVLTGFQADANGNRKFALYGAGQHTQRVLSILAEQSALPLAIADDRADLWGKRVGGVQVVEPKSLPALGVQHIVLSSDHFERELWDKSKSLRNQGLTVFPLYDTYAA